MNSFIENVNEGRGKKMLQILFVEESKADHEKMENRPQVETLQSNFVETSSVPVLEVAHPNSEGVYILTYNNENITADDVLKGEFLFDDTNIELQEVQLVTEVNNNNQEYEEQEEVKTYDQEVNMMAITFMRTMFLIRVMIIYQMKMVIVLIESMKRMKTLKITFNSQY
ncbi:uncharacterized protein [Leptinotarsa decemlineata]|uniref:uncharacterized protein n=1 Tax=Leptinotarsa decemlineata TaxID=7539 RepID=UPI003D3069DE